MKGPLSKLIIALALAVSLPAWPAAYIKFDGVEGESRRATHGDEIEVLSFSWGTSSRETGSGLATGQRQHQALTFTLTAGKSSPKLQEALASETPLTNVRLVVDGRETVMHSARVVSIERDADGNEVVTLEEVTGRARTSPAAGASEAKKKGNVESAWKVEEGTR